MSGIILLSITVACMAGAFAAGLQYGKSISQDEAWNDGAKAILQFVPDEEQRERIGQLLDDDLREMDK